MSRALREPREIVLERTLSQADFDAFAHLSGDDNPIHVDPGFAAGTRFGRTVAHGVLLCSILRAMAERLVPDARQLSQQLKFPAPSYAGEPLRFRVRIDAIDRERVTLVFSATRTADGTVTCEGRSVLEAPAGKRR